MRLEARLTMLAVLAGVASCGREPPLPRSPVGQTTTRGAPAAPVRAAVPAGTKLEIEMGESVSTDTGYVGQRFEAYLLEPLVAADGAVIAELGAVVHGVVTDIEGGETPALALDFETVETKLGDAPLSVRFEGFDLRPPIGERPEASRAPLRFHPPEASSPGGEAAPDVRFHTTDGSAIRVPLATRLRLELTRPLLVTSR